MFPGKICYLLENRQYYSELSTIPILLLKRGLDLKKPVTSFLKAHLGLDEAQLDGCNGKYSV